MHPISHLSEYQKILSKVDKSQNRTITFKIIKATSRRTRNQLSTVVTSGGWEGEMGNTFYFTSVQFALSYYVCIFIFLSYLLNYQ